MSILRALGFLLLLVPSCFGQVGPSVRLEMVDVKTSFTLGESIRLQLVFTGSAPGKQVNTFEYSELSDDVTITPADGWFQTHGPSYQDQVNFEKLVGEPLRVGLLLNEAFVFQKPGHYQVTVTTRRMYNEKEYGRDDGLTTNTLDLELKAPDEEAEAAHVKLLDARIAATNDFDERDAAVVELAYLGGDAAIRAKVRWLRDLREDEMAGNLLSDLSSGLASSRNFPLQQSLLEARWHDATEARRIRPRSMRCWPRALTSILGPCPGSKLPCLRRRTRRRRSGWRTNAQCTCMRWRRRCRHAVGRIGETRRIT